ncbi:MAG: hypothetical protein KH414_01480 [Tannerella sp.]|nr:hypothetical protein [Tannerella sp.]
MNKALRRSNMLNIPVLNFQILSTLGASEILYHAGSIRNAVNNIPKIPSMSIAE